MIYITGDTHGQFEHIEKFCLNTNTIKDDILIILGDSGVNYFGDIRDMGIKNRLSKLPITLFCIHGNHDLRPQHVKSYEIKDFYGGKVWIDSNFPNLIFAKDGEIYKFNGLNTLVCGGAYSVDKMYRIIMEYKWFADEQPSESIKALVESKINKEIDVILTHTCPIRYEPTEWFIKGLDQSKIDKSTEIWLDSIYDKIGFHIKKWYCGHFHGEKRIDNIEFMYNNIHEFL